MGKGQREMYRQIHGRHLCPDAAINPNVEQNSLALPLIGIWTKGATTGQTCSGQPGQGSCGFIHRPAMGFLGGWRVVPGRSSLVGSSTGSELTV